jgi:hypothetical protein
MYGVRSRLVAATTKRATASRWAMFPRLPTIISLSQGEGGGGDGFDTSDEVGKKLVEPGRFANPAKESRTG